MKAMPPKVPKMMSILAISSVTQVIKNRRKSGTTSAKCAKSNGKTTNNHTDATIQNIDASISGGRARFRLPVATLASEEF